MLVFNQFAAGPNLMFSDAVFSRNRAAQFRESFPLPYRLPAVDTTS